MTILVIGVLAANLIVALIALFQSQEIREKVLEQGETSIAELKKQHETTRELIAKQKRVEGVIYADASSTDETKAKLEGVIYAD